MKLKYKKNLRGYIFVFKFDNRSIFFNIKNNTVERNLFHVKCSQVRYYLFNFDVYYNIHTIYSSILYYNYTVKKPQTIVSINIYFIYTCCNCGCRRVLQEWFKWQGRCVPVRGAWLFKQGRHRRQSDEPYDFQGDEIFGRLWTDLGY